MRRRQAPQGFGADQAFRWRGGEISRLEGLSDAVFAFAVTLLVVSLEVPETFDELLRVLRGFFAFAVCFAILFWVWHDHYRFFRRYGLVSIAIVEVGGPDAALWSGMTYMLIAPLQMLNGRVMGGRIRQATTTSPQP